MKANIQKEFKLMASIFKIGVVGFGGGTALIPVIEREVVEDQKIVEKSEYDKDVIVASITPGALPVEIATGLGKRAYGARGMALAAFLMAFPGVLMTVLMLSVLSKVDEQLFVQIECLSIGLTAFISCLLTQYAVKSMQEAKKESTKRFQRAFVIMIAVFLLSCGKSVYSILGIKASPIFGLSTVQVLGIAFFGIFYTHCRFNIKNTLVSGIIIILYVLCVGKAGIIQNAYLETGLKVLMFVLAIRGLCICTRYGMSKGKRPEEEILKSGNKLTTAKFTKEMVTWFLFLLILSIPAVIITKDTWLYLLRGFASSIISFGGGDAYLSVADGMFVSTGMIKESEFYSQLVSIVNVLPGSILCKTLAGIGYFIGYDINNSILEGFGVALAGFACSVAASGVVFCIIYYLYEKFEGIAVFRLIGRWIRPIIAGLLLNVMVSMIYQNIATGLAIGGKVAITLVITFIIYIVNLVLMLKVKAGNGVLILISAVFGLVLCNGILI